MWNIRIRMKILLEAPVVTFLPCNKQALPVKQNKAGFLQHLLHLLALQMHCTGFWEEKRNQQISLDCLLFYWFLPLFHAVIISFKLKWSLQLLSPESTIKTIRRRPPFFFPLIICPIPGKLWPCNKLGFLRNEKKNLLHFHGYVIIISGSTFWVIMKSTCMHVILFALS